MHYVQRSEVLTVADHNGGRGEGVHEPRDRHVHHDHGHDGDTVGQGRSRPPRISDEAAIMAMMGTRLYKADYPMLTCACLGDGFAILQGQSAWWRSCIWTPLKWSVVGYDRVYI
jgi:hypothetical protein